MEIYQYSDNQSLKTDIADVLLTLSKIVWC